MLNTIIAIVIVIIMLAYCYRMIHRIYKCKSWFTEFVVVMLCLLVLTFADSDSIINTHAIKDAYNDGFNHAIKTAEVVDYNNDGYTISFGDNIPELHNYTHE